MEDQPRINLWEKATSSAPITEEKHFPILLWEVFEEFRMRLDSDIKTQSAIYQMFFSEE